MFGFSVHTISRDEGDSTIGSGKICSRNQLCQLQIPYIVLLFGPSLFFGLKFVSLDYSGHTTTPILDVRPHFTFEQNKNNTKIISSTTSIFSIFFFLNKKTNSYYFFVFLIFGYQKNLITKLKFYTINTLELKKLFFTNDIDDYIFP